jgi:hypothetical protein
LPGIPEPAQGAALFIISELDMADNGLGTTLLPALAIDAGLLRGTKLIARSLLVPSTGLERSQSRAPLSQGADRTAA